MGSKGLGKGKKLASVYMGEELKATANVLAQSYRMTFSHLVQLLIEDAVERWAVPGAMQRPRPGEAVQTEKDLT